LPEEPRNTPHIGPDHQLPAPGQPTGRSRTVKTIIWVVVLAVFGLVFFLVLRQHNEQAATAGAARRGGGGAVTINAITAKKGNIGVYLDAIGTVTPVYSATITSQVNGIITAVHYREGQLVHKGDPLIDIDSRPYQATLLQAQGTLERDENILAQAKMDLQRYKDAWAKNAIPKQTLDDQEKIALQDEGTVKIDQGAVQYDQIQVEFCHIVSPITGRVGLRLIDPGNVVQSGSTTPLAVVTQLQPITAIFTIPEDNLGQVAPHLAKNGHLTVTAYDRTGLNKIADGTLLTLDNLIDTTTGTVKGRATFANANNALYPNQFVNTRLLVDTLHGVTLVPTSAIQHNGSTAFVYIVQQGWAHIRNVTPGVTDGDTTQVVGIDPGDEIADSSFDKLQNSSKVVLTKKPVPASTVGSSAP
jgi:multidrug efflux system membrane fusion protein